MKYICLIMVLAISISLLECENDIVNNSKEPAPKLLLEDCEDGDNCTLLGGWWYVTTDSTKGGKSRITISKDSAKKIQLTGKGYQSNYSFEMGYYLLKGNSFKPFVLCGFKLFSKGSDLFDLSNYEGISYFFKGPAHSIRIETSLVEDFCYHSCAVDSSDNWQKVVIPFSKLKQESWGKQMSFDSTAVKGISWQISGDDNDSSKIMIDNIALEKTVTDTEKEIQNDIKIQGIGIEISATLYKPDGSGKFPLVIVLPGGTSASDIGTAYSHHHYFGKLFSSKKIAVLVLDYSSESRTFFDTLQIADIGKAVEYAKKLPFVEPDAVFLNGFSIGGANALRTAGSIEDIAGIICYFSPCDWRISGGGHGIKKQPIDYCNSIHCPVLILQGDSDKVTDISQSQLLYDSLKAMGKNAELVIYKGAAHGFTYEGAPAGNCVYSKEIAESSYLKVESFIKTVMNKTM